MLVELLLLELLLKNVALNTHTTEIGADIATATFLCAACAGTVSKVFLLKAAIAGFNSGSSILVETILRLVTGEYTALLMYPRICGTGSLAADVPVLPGEDNIPVSPNKAFPMSLLIYVYFLVTGLYAREGASSSLPALDGVAVITPPIVCILCIPLVSGGDNILTRAGFLLLLILDIDFTLHK